MNQNIKPDEWVWIVVQNPGGNEQILGQFEPEKEISFIPTFKTKEDAQNGFLQIQREGGLKYEIQAILFEDLTKYASDNRFIIFILNAVGKILERIDPSGEHHEQ